MKADPRHLIPVLILTLGMLQGSPVCGQTKTSVPLMPLPAQISLGEGQLPIDGSFSVRLEGYTEPRLVLARQRFLETLRRETGIAAAQC